MAASTIRKRAGDELPKSKAGRLTKKQKKLKAYHSDSDDSDEDQGQDQDDFQAVNLLDSDDDIENAVVDDGASSHSGDDSDDSSDSLDNLPNEEAPRKKQRIAKDDASSSDDDNANDEDSDSGSDGASSADSQGRRSGKAGRTSKRNDPSTFSTSLQKILGTKLSTTRRADPVLARSAAARDASRRIVDAALEEKARKQMRLEKRAALEKGRVKDVLVAHAPRAGGEEGGEGEEEEAETTASILASERRLRKVAQRGVVQLFNAVRAAKVKAAEAERTAKQEGLLGMDKREAKVTEMSRKGFLDLIASGGGAKKKRAETEE